MPNLRDLADKIAAKLHHWLETLVIMLPNLVVALLLVIAAHFVGRWVRRGVKRVVGRVSNNAPISDLLATMARVAVMLVAVFIALGLLELDRTVTSLLAGVGVVGLALGFAFQDIAANFMSGVMMAVRRPFVVGDLVKVADTLGKVQRIALRATELETNDGLSALIPNKDIFQATIINYTRTDRRRMDLPVAIAYHEDMEQVQRIVREAVAELTDRDPGREVEVFFTEFNDFSIDLVVRIWLLRSEQRRYVAARSEAMVAIKRAFDREGITIPFPIRTLDFGAHAVGGQSLDTTSLRVTDAREATDVG